MEIKKKILRRCPPGDRWTIVTGAIDSDDERTGRIFASLTAGLEAIFSSTGCKQYYIDAGEGFVYMIMNAQDPEPVIPQFSIYGDR